MRHRYYDIDCVVEYIIDLLRPQIKETMSEKIVTGVPLPHSDKTYISNITFKTFIKNFEIRLDVRHGLANMFNGSVDDAVLIDENGNWICDPKIYMVLVATSEAEAVRMCQLCLAHELTHGYNFVEYAIKNGFGPVDTRMGRSYRKIIEEMRQREFDEKFTFVHDLLYRLSRLERNAFIGQIYTELRNYDMEGKSFQEIYELIFQTRTYKSTVKNIEDENNYLQAVTGQDLQKEIIEQVNYLTNKKFTNFEQVKKYFQNRVDKWKKAFFRKVIKIAYDAYYKNTAMGGIEQINEVVKIRA